MEIKRIQLRGISRAPSDRLTEDGGLSESLNMYLDTAESAPAFVPEDVTAKLGMPDDLIAERIFIHKTANYENFIAVTDGSILAFTPQIEEDLEPLHLLYLADECVNDITSVGNTVLIYTDKTSYFFLFVDGVYKFIGNKIPFPEIRFITGDYAEVYAKTKITYSNNDTWYDSPYESITQVERESDAIDDYFDDGRDRIAQKFPSIERWNSLGSSNSHKKGILESIWNNIQTELNDAFPNYCAGAQIVRYAVRLYDDSLISSMPLLVNPNGAFSTADLIWKQQHERLLDYNKNLFQTGDTVVEVNSTTPLFPIQAKLMDENFYQGWEDIIKDIVFYAAPATLFLDSKLSSEMTSRKEGNKDVSSIGVDTIATSYQINATITLGKNDRASYESAVIGSAEQTFQIMTLSFEPEKRTESINKLREGLNLEFIRDTAELVQKDCLLADDMAHNITLFKNALSYNNRVVAPAVSTQLIFDHHNLNALQISKLDDPAGSVIKDEYDVAFLIKDSLGRDLCVRKQFVYVDGADYKTQVFAFQTFPDSRCYKMLVQLKQTFSTGASGMTSTYYGEFDMKRFPSMDCAYMIGEYGQSLNSLLTSEKPAEWDKLDSFGSPVTEIKNKLFISKQDNPFFFPLTGRYTFSSSVLSAAIASTALSQGQFGQFPLYVFTEDGIWAMETAADGSFVTSKPLSREVCINPDSITSVDNAVVFVTDKGVMMISGAQVANISPFMNGKHYLPSDSALGIIKSQEGYSELINAINDKEPFMSFVKSAKVAYDYAGQRLIFMSEGKDFQYVYKTDTQTWHKIAFEGFDLVQPLNSYPDCLVQGVAKKSFPEIYCTENMSPLDSYELLEKYGKYFGMDLTYLEHFLNYGERVPLYGVSEKKIVALQNSMREDGINIEYNLVSKEKTCVYDLSTVLDASRSQQTAKGVIITRPFDLDYPDVLKSITDVRVRGEFRRSAVKFILMGSNDGIHWATLGTLRGKSWKLFRIAILADLEPTERISWVDIGFETRFTNRLR